LLTSDAEPERQQLGRAVGGWPMSKDEPGGSSQHDKSGTDQQ